MKNSSIEYFEKQRPQLLQLAYSMLGSHSEAEDIIQEAYLRWEKVDISEIESPGAYLSTIVTRLCLDELKSARRQREQYIGPWIPEPVLTSEEKPPDQQNVIAERLSIAVLHTLEQLNPVQRAVFLLHDVFGYPYKEIGQILDIKAATCRKTAQRARRHLQDKQPAPAAPSAIQKKKLNTFLEAMQAGDIESIRRLLAKDATLYSDGGGKVTAARKPILGADRISRFLAKIVSQTTSDMNVYFTFINGDPGFVVYLNDQLHSAWTFQISADSIESLYVVLNPDKLAHVKRQLSHHPPHKQDQP